MISEAECRTILGQHFRPRETPLEKPTQSDWDQLARKLGCTFPAAFRIFMGVVGEYCFEGGLLLVVAEGDLGGEDTIATAHETEEDLGGWPSHAVPFYDVGNGDYYCLRSDEGENSSVYYCYHEDRSLERVSESFEHWVRGLPDY